jgi:trigger factor
LQRQGVGVDTYLKATGKTRAEVIDEAKADAAQALARESVLEAVADAESIEVSEQELLDVLDDAAKAEGADAAQLLERLRENGREAAIARDLRIRKAVDVLVEGAKPIPVEQAKVREQIWTPEKEKSEQGSSQLWTPGSGEPAARPGQGVK